AAAGGAERRGGCADRRRRAAQRLAARAAGGAGGDGLGCGGRARGLAIQARPPAHAQPPRVKRIGMRTWAPSTGRPSSVNGFMRKKRESFRAASPKPSPTGDSAITWQSPTPPPAVTRQL